MPSQYEDAAGPTDYRIAQADSDFDLVGRGRQKYTFLDDALGRAWKRRNISAEEYSALKKYALHWLAGGLQGHLGSVDLNRIFSFDPGSMTGLTKTEAQADHRALYWAARADLGEKSWCAFVADQVALYDNSVSTIGVMLGYRSPSRGREKAVEFLKDAGYRLGKFWNDQAKRN